MPALTHSVPTSTIMARRPYGGAAASGLLTGSYSLLVSLVWRIGLFLAAPSFARAVERAGEAAHAAALAKECEAHDHP